METQLEWWGYKHVSGTYHVKKFFDQRDIDDALESDFCAQVSNKFVAKDREDALTILKSKLY